MRSIYCAGTPLFSETHSVISLIQVNKNPRFWLLALSVRSVAHDLAAVVGLLLSLLATTLASITGSDGGFCCWQRT